MFSHRRATDYLWSIIRFTPAIDLPLLIAFGLIFFEIKKRQTKNLCFQLQ